jgi:hypothetical protein
VGLLCGGSRIVEAGARPQLHSDLFDFEAHHVNQHNSRIFSEGSKPKLAKEMEIYERLDTQTEADSMPGGPPSN